MIIGFDFHNVLDAYPDYFRELAVLALASAKSEVHIISAIGMSRVGTIEDAVKKLKIPYTKVHEVVFTHPRYSPRLKTHCALQNGIEVFYDDRQDVCDLMNHCGILCFKVPRVGEKSDIEADFR